MEEVAVQARAEIDETDETDEQLPSIYAMTDNAKTETTATVATNTVKMEEIKTNVVENKTKPISTYGFLPTTVDGWVIFFAYYTITLLFFLAAYFGGQLPFYQNLIKKDPQNAWLIAGLWVGASLISYAAFYLVRGSDPNLHMSQNLWIWFLISNYLNILWVILFYIYQSFYATIIIVFLIILIYFYLMIILFPISVWAALSLLPLLALYVYLIYSFLHLMGVNGIVL